MLLALRLRWKPPEHALSTGAIFVRTNQTRYASSTWSTLPRDSPMPRFNECWHATHTSRPLHTWRGCGSSPLHSLTPSPPCCVFDMSARLLKLEIDTPVANLVGEVLQKLQGGVSAAAKESVEVLLDSVRASRMFPKYQEMLEQMNVRTYFACYINIQTTASPVRGWRILLKKLVFASCV